MMNGSASKATGCAFSARSMRSSGRGGDRLFRWRRFPQRKKPQKPVAFDLFPEKLLVFRFDSSHRQQAIDVLVQLCFLRECSGHLVLADVPQLQPASAVHRDEPLSDVTERADDASDRPEDRFANWARLCA